MKVHQNFYVLCRRTSTALGSVKEACNCIWSSSGRFTAISKWLYTSLNTERYQTLFLSIIVYWLNAICQESKMRLMILLKDRHVHVILKLRSGWISCRFDFFCLFCLFFFPILFFLFFSFAFLFFLLVSFFFLLLLQRFLSKKRFSKIHV